ncbi:hypothetical protein R84B8_00884 [Treponema sp. R8-4-B8]
MFLFNSLHQGSMALKSLVSKSRKASGSPASSSLRRNFARGVFALAVIFCLTTALLFTGCNTDDNSVDTGFIPVGEWTAEWDGYTITDTRVEYGDLKGDIEKAIDFSANAGVLIIKITASSGDFTVNKYTGVYYSEYTSTSIKLANVWLQDSNDAWYPLETDSLSAAISLFSVDNVGDHVSYWGTYTKE